MSEEQNKRIQGDAMNAVLWQRKVQRQIFRMYGTMGDMEESYAFQNPPQPGEYFFFFIACFPKYYKLEERPSKTKFLTWNKF